MNDRLIDLLQCTLVFTNQRRELLQDRETLREILKDTPARKWLFQQANQENDQNQATKARALIVAIMQYSDRIWRGNYDVSIDVYQEALARTWKWFSENLPIYEPETTSFTTWFNNRLRYAILDVIAELRPYEQIPDDFPTRKSNNWDETLDQWRDLVNRDPQNNLRDRRMQNHQHVNCQNLLLEVFEQVETSEFVDWDAIAAQFNTDPISIERFCKSRCSPIFHSLLDS